MQATSPLRKLWAPLIAIVGPAAVMAAGIMGAGSTVSTLAAGCWFGYDLLWAVLLSLPVIVVCQDTASRIGALAGGKGMMSVIAEQTSPLLMWLIVVPLLLTCISANVGQLGAMAAAVSNLINLAAGDGGELIGAKPSLPVNAAVVFPLAVVALLVNAFGGYKRIEKLLTFLLCVVLVSFLVVAAQAFVHWEQVRQMAAGLWPHMPADAPIPGTSASRSAFISFTSIIGGGVAATAILSFPYFTTEGGYNMDNIRAKFRRHVLLFGLVFGVYSCALMIAGAFALHGQEGSAGFNDARQMGMALQRVLGPTGTVFFSIGLFICGFNTLTVVAQLGSYFILDSLGRDWRFGRSNRAFLIPFVSMILLPAVMTVFWQFPNLLKVVISMVFNCLVAPLAIGLIIYLINKRSLAGALKASWARNLVLAYGMMVVLLSAYRAGQGLWSTFAR